MSKFNYKNKNIALLDNIRIQQGGAQMKNLFNHLLEQDQNAAINLINDSRLQFPSLYILQKEIMKLKLENFLNERNRLACVISAALLDRRRPKVYKNRIESYPLLHWMLQTGYSEENMDDSYNEVMDLISILLVREFHDQLCLDYIEKMIFNRHRKGLSTYDAEWAYFECRDPACLDRVANRLFSSDQQDVALARRLLGFIPCFSENDGNPAMQHRCATQWITRNRPFLRYTGESNQQCFHPCHYEVSLENKYLQKPFAQSKESAPFSKEEQSVLRKFSALDYDTKMLLSEYSNDLHAKSIDTWQEWMQLPQQEQIKRLNTGKESTQ